MTREARPMVHQSLPFVVNANIPTILATAEENKRKDKILNQSKNETLNGLIKEAHPNTHHTTNLEYVVNHGTHDLEKLKHAQQLMLNIDHMVNDGLINPNAKPMHRVGEHSAHYTDPYYDANGRMGYFTDKAKNMMASGTKFDTLHQNNIKDTLDYLKTEKIPYTALIEFTNGEMSQKTVNPANIANRHITGVYNLQHELESTNYQQETESGYFDAYMKNRNESYEMDIDKASTLLYKDKFSERMANGVLARFANQKLTNRTQYVEDFHPTNDKQAPYEKIAHYKEILKENTPNMIRSADNQLFVVRTQAENKAPSYQIIEASTKTINEQSLNNMAMEVTPYDEKHKPFVFQPSNDKENDHFYVPSYASGIAYAKALYGLQEAELEAKINHENQMSNDEPVLYTEYAKSMIEKNKKNPEKSPLLPGEFASTFRNSTDAGRDMIVNHIKNIEPTPQKSRQKDDTGLDR